MVSPVEICLENIDLPEDDERYLRCVALPDAEPGLCLDAMGEVQWMPAESEVTGLWVSGDERLVLIRAEDAAAVWVERAGRALQAPAGKPVVLLHHDLLRIGDKRLRLHVHGPTEQIFPPEPLPASSFRRMVRGAAAAVALGAATLAGSGAATGHPGQVRGTPIEVRDKPPVVARVKRPVDCKIDRIDKGAKGIKLEAHCPARTPLYKGMFGTLIDTSKKVIPHGSVKITKVDKGKVWAAGTVELGKAKVAAVRFYVDD